MFPPGIKHAADAPKFIINPAAATESIWLPRIYQVVFGHKNKSYLNSLWLGTLWQLIEMPERLWYEGFKPTLHGRPDVALKCLLHMPLSVVSLLISGVLGRAMAVDITAPPAQRGAGGAARGVAPDDRRRLHQGGAVRRDRLHCHAPKRAVMSKAAKSPSAPPARHQERVAHRAPFPINPPRQAAPNHAWCVGCGPLNCPGCRPKTLG